MTTSDSFIGVQSTDNEASPLRLLIVDDDKEASDVLAEELMRRGNEVRLANNANDAHDAMDAFEPDVVLVDGRLEQGNGIDLIYQFRSRRPQLLCILLIANPDVGMAIEAMRHGVYDFFRKPIVVDLLETALWRAQEVVRERRQKERAEKEKREIDQRFRDFAEASSDWFWEMDADLRFSYFSTRFTEATGIDPEQFLGKTRQETGNPEVDPATWDDHLALLEGHMPFRNFIHPRKKDDSTIWVSINGKPMFDEVGRFQGYRGTGTDITKEKQEEQELRKLSHALEQSPSMVFITDAEGNIEYVNPMFTKISGYAIDEVIGNNPRILKSGETPSDVYVELWRTIKSGHEWKGELKDKRKDGSKFWAYATISPVKDSDGEITHFVSMHEDITQRKEIELRELKAKEQAEMANRAKSELLANMSHELRTPLNAIIGFSDMMKSETFGPLNEKYMEYASDINKSGEHLLELINDILDVSAIEAGKLELHEENLDVGKVVEAVITMIKGRSTDTGIYLTSNANDDLPMLHADKRRLMQILLNLLSNAIKFTPPDGEVSLTALLDDGDAHVFTVTDTGVGMDEEDLAMAMTEFGQVDSGLDRIQEGTGLGLPLTRGLIELHGGTFNIDSKKGEGTTVTVRFPPERTVKMSALGQKQT